MSVAEIIWVLVAGLAAGALNAVVGSGTLITFPTLLTIGIPPVTANVSNTVGLVAGGVTSSWGYRKELRDQKKRFLRLVPASFAGAIVGAILLLVLPESAFNAIVPVLILLGCVLVVVQPKLQPLIAKRERPAHGAWWVAPAVFLAGIYGGYFGAAQGVLLMAVFGLGLDNDLQKMNGLKNLLALVVNLVAAITFIIVRPINWPVAGLIALGSLVGGALGASFARRLPSWLLRSIIVIVGLVAVAKFLL